MCFFNQKHGLLLKPERPWWSTPSCWWTRSSRHLIRFHFCPIDSVAWAFWWQSWQQGVLPETRSSNSSRPQLQPETFQQGSTFRLGSGRRCYRPEITNWEFRGNRDFAPWVIQCILNCSRKAKLHETANFEQHLSQGNFVYIFRQETQRTTGYCRSYIKTQIFRIFILQILTYDIVDCPQVRIFPELFGTLVGTQALLSADQDLNPA